MAGWISGEETSHCTEGYSRAPKGELLIIISIHVDYQETD
jgi:hypothetical protein